MKTKLTAAEKWWSDCAEYEATHTIAFASPSALAHARVLVELDEARRALRHARRKVPPHRRRTTAA